MSENIATSSNDDRHFGEAFLTDILLYIRDNFDPDEIYLNAQLIAWADNQNPEDVFSVEELENWALRNGWVISP